MARPTPSPFSQLEAHFVEWTGIDLGRGGRTDSLERFIQGRVRTLGLRSVDAYVEALPGWEPERRRLANAATVGLTWFFRDPGQLRVVGDLLREGYPPGRHLRIWVAGCATGEDVYSLAMIARAEGRPVSIVGTDLNSDFIERARAGIYRTWSSRTLPAEHAEWLVPLDEQRMAIHGTLAESTSFVVHNLMSPPPAPERGGGSGGGGFDLILCRNVLLYFHPHKLELVTASLGGALAPDGWLFVGANDPVQTVRGLAPAPIGDRSAFRRAPPAPAAPPARATKPAEGPPAERTRAKPAPTPVPSSHIVTAEVAALVARAHARHSAGHVADALQLYAEVLARDALHVEARLFLGIAYVKCGDYDEGAQALRAALFLVPELWPAAFYLALAYDKLGHPADAAREYRRLLTAAEQPLAISSDALAELEAWKPEVLELARRRAGEVIS